MQTLEEEVKLELPENLKSQNQQLICNRFCWTSGTKHSLNKQSGPGWAAGSTEPVLFSHTEPEQNLSGEQFGPVPTFAELCSRDWTAALPMP